jgi:(5-formylfuran-3-yl)methyl phosphate synthase
VRCFDLKLLVSPSDEKEALEAIAGGADIIDVKNPKEGSLGASFPWIIKQIRELAPEGVEVSCTIGDLPNLPGSVSLAVLGAAATGVKYVKVGLGKVKSNEDAVFLLRSAVRAAKDYDSSIKVVVTGYADAVRIGSVNPLLIPEITAEANADVAMLDTSVKDGKNLFTFLTTAQLEQMVREAHDRGLLVALAGSLTKAQVPRVQDLEADIVGLRGAACTNGDRVRGRISREAVREMADTVRSVEKRVEVVT